MVADNEKLIEALLNQLDYIQAEMRQEDPTMDMAWYKGYEFYLKTLITQLQSGEIG